MYVEEIFFALQHDNTEHTDIYPYEIGAFYSEQEARDSINDYIEDICGTDRECIDEQWESNYFTIGWMPIGRIRTSQDINKSYSFKSVERTNVSK